MGCTVMEILPLWTRRSDRDVDNVINPTRPFEPLEPWRDEPDTPRRGDRDFNEAHPDDRPGDDE